MHIKPINAQQLLTERLARDKGIIINENLLKTKIEDLFRQLELSKLFEIWIVKGRVIFDLNKRGGINDSKLSDACRTFVSLQGSKISDAYKSYQELNSLKVYGAKSEFLPYDFESEADFHNTFSILQENGFFPSISKIELAETTIESNILNLLKEKSCTYEEITNKFILLSANCDILNQVYIPLLVHKGRIIKKQNEVYKLSIA